MLFFQKNQRECVESMKKMYKIICLMLALLLAATVASAATEIPYFQAAVDAGRLQPVAERLPADPLVEHADEIGTYGGTMRRTYTGVADFKNLNYINVIWEPLVFVNDRSEVTGNILEKWEYSGDGLTTLTIEIRKGIRWSDGEPFTIDDVMYFLDVYDTGNVALEQNGVQSKVIFSDSRKLDNYRAELKLTEYYPVEYGYVYEQPYAPSHYLKQFDPREDSGKTWEDLSNAWCSSSISAFNANLPSLTPWHVTSYTDNGLIVAERNPYYWKVDQAGNQLPYIDRVELSYVASSASIPAMVVNGEIDFQVRHLAFSDFAYFKQNEANGGYEVKALTASSLGACIRLNYAAENLELRELFRNFEFRKALSNAINRDAINQSIFFGLAEPWGNCPLPGAINYPGDEYSKLHIEFDLEGARTALDGMGLIDSNNDGVREVNGRPITIVIYCEDGVGAGPHGVIELVAEQWRALGIDTIVSVVERPLLLTHWGNNTYDTYAWRLDGAINPVIYNYAWSTLSASNYYWHNAGVPLQLWWETDGAEGVEPMDFIKEINAKITEALVETDDARHIQLGKEVGILHAENLFVIPTTTSLEVGVVNANLRNVPETWMAGNEFTGEQVARPWTFFYVP